MTVRLYLDVHVPRAVTDGLRLRGVDALTAQEDEAALLHDAELLTRATEQGRLLFTQGEDLLAEAARRQRTGETFGGLVHAHQLNVTIGRLIADLELIAGATDIEDVPVLPHRSPVRGEICHCRCPPETGGRTLP